MIELRDYQHSAVEAVVNFIKYRSPLHGYLTAPGGSGKSVIIAAIAGACFDMGLRVVILARNEKLLRQNRAKLAKKYQPECGIYCAGLGEKDASKAITIASTQSIATLSGSRFDIALVDEADEIPPEEGGEDSQYWKFFRNNGNPRIIGFTATPYRTKSGQISWGREISKIPLKSLIDYGFLVAPINKVGASPDLSKVDVSLGEFVSSQLENVYLEPELLKITIAKLLHYGSARNHPIVFCQSLRHADVLARALEDNGQTCFTVSGDTPKDELDGIFADFERGWFKWLINCRLLTVGIDIPCIDMVAIVMATQSKRLFEQMTYRGTRLCEGKKDFLLLDMGGNLQRHGPLGSPFRGEKSREAKPSNGKICPRCEEFVDSASASECASCGFQFPAPEVRRVDHHAAPDTVSQAVYTDHIQSYDVSDVTYSIHTNKKNGNKSIRVNYYCDYGKYGSIAEWISPHHENDFVRGKASDFFNKRGGCSHPDVLMNISLDDLIFECGKLKKPIKIIVDHSQEFPRIKEYLFADDVDNNRPQPDDESTEDFLDDFIPF